MGKRYSDATISDDNYDEEFEKLCDKLGLSYASESRFVKSQEELNYGGRYFTKAYCDNEEFKCDIWTHLWMLPNHSAEASNVRFIEDSAFEFANGFMIMYGTMYDSIFN